MTTPIPTPSLTETPAWQALLRHRTAIMSQSLSDRVQSDPARLGRLTYRHAGLSLCAALSMVTDETLGLLGQLAEQQGLASWRDRMMAGEAVNTGEGRAALHMALRQKVGQPQMAEGQDVSTLLASEQQRQIDFVDAVRSGARCGATGRPFRHVVSIGIGGSDLGPRMAVKALREYAQGLDVRFVANLDPAEFDRVVADLPPEETLFILVSKTFTTQETISNAHLARQWLSERLGTQAPTRHFVAVTMAPDKAMEFGIGADLIFPIWDWVGGRYSLWSAVGLGLRLALGNNHFAEMLAGAAAMDHHFATTPFSKNLPVLHALIGVWNRNFLDLPAVAVLPYSDALRDFPRFLQQLAMESNGKSVTRDGGPVACATSPIVFGERGTVSQHGFHQWLHQAPQKIAADFIGIKRPRRQRDDVANKAMLSNMAAQAWVLAAGHPDANPNLVHEGNRPSVTLMLNQLDPANFGALLAHYEHKTFVEAVVWGINPFDQPGVELGKKIARDLLDTEHKRTGAGSPQLRFFDHLLAN